MKLLSIPHLTDAFDSTHLLSITHITNGIYDSSHTRSGVYESAIYRSYDTRSLSLIPHTLRRHVTFIMDVYGWYICVYMCRTCVSHVFVRMSYLFVGVSNTCVAPKIMSLTRKNHVTHMRRWLDSSLTPSMWCQYVTSKT